MIRFIKFQGVGALGIVVQLGVLTLLKRTTGLSTSWATALAVESAILHNFVWHERWTWSDRVGPHREGMVKRLVRFHLANGALSLGGNLILMRLLVGAWSMNYAVANGVSITICSFLNFLASDRFVFQRTLRKSGACGFAFRPQRLPRGDVVTRQ